MLWKKGSLGEACRLARGLLPRDDGRADHTLDVINPGLASCLTGATGGLADLWHGAAVPRFREWNTCLLGILYCVPRTEDSILVGGMKHVPGPSKGWWPPFRQLMSVQPMSVCEVPCEKPRQGAKWEDKRFSHRWLMLRNRLWTATCVTLTPSEDEGFAESCEEPLGKP